MGDPKHAARGIAVGRVAIGLVLIARPAHGIRGWLGPAAAEDPATQVLARGLGIRDLILGAITLHTLGHPEVAPRWVATCAVADLVDAGATIAARKTLPTAGVVGAGALAAASAVAGVVIAAQLRAAAKTAA